MEPCRQNLPVFAVVSVLAFYSVARALVTGRSQALGVVTFNTTLYGPASTLVGVERAAAAAGYAVSIVKAGVRLVGQDGGPVRPPLGDCTAQEHEELKVLIDKLGPQ